MTIAQRLTELFTETAGPGGRPVTLQEIITRIERGGVATMSMSYLQQLRSGKALNPTLAHLRALADAFDVPIVRLIPDAEQDTATETNTALTPDEAAVARALHGLSPRTLATVRQLLDIARQADGLDTDHPRAARTPREIGSRT